MEQSLSSNNFIVKTFHSFNRYDHVQTSTLRATFVKALATYWVKTDAFETVDIIIPVQDTTTTVPVNISIT